MIFKTDDVRITGLQEVIPPAELHAEFPLGDQGSETVYHAREAIHNILQGEDDRMVVVVGPCSIHDPDAARDYAEHLKPLIGELSSDLCIVMRVYFEKPRTTVGWKGLINDPDMDESFHINKGLRLARGLLLDLAEKGVPAGSEFLDLISPQYIADLVSWGAIGARTTESQGHRELASGLSCPIGFKNSTDGGFKIAIDAVHAASKPHVFMSLSKDIPPFFQLLVITIAILFYVVVKNPITMLVTFNMLPSNWKRMPLSRSSWWIAHMRIAIKITVGRSMCAAMSPYRSVTAKSALLALC